MLSSNKTRLVLSVVLCVLSDVDTLNGACLKLIDFGRSIDMTLFPAGTTFNTNCYTEDFQCIEMKESRPWTTQVPNEPSLQLVTIKMCLIVLLFSLVRLVAVTTSHNLTNRFHVAVHLFSN